MGYSISQEAYEKLECYRREGRRCDFATGRGGCFNRATVRQTHESWPYKIGEGNKHIATMTFCGRHAEPVGSEGVNYRVIGSERY